MRRSMLYTIRVGVVALLTAISTFLIATPARAAYYTVAWIECWDYPWPQHNWLDYTAYGSGYPANYNLHVIRQVFKGNTFLTQLDSYPRTSSGGSWSVGWGEYDLGATGGSGTYKLFVFVNDRYDQGTLAIQTDTCSI